jgi:hypothetical protein
MGKDRQNIFFLIFCMHRIQFAVNEPHQTVNQKKQTVPARMVTTRVDLLSFWHRLKTVVCLRHRAVH